MPIQTRLVTLSDVTPAKITEPDVMPHRVTLHNMSKSSNQFVHIGNGDVTKDNSIHIDPGQTISLTLGPADVLFAVSDPTGIKVGVLDVRKRR